MKTTKHKSLHQCHCSVCQRAPKSAEAKEHQAINRVATLLHEKGRRQFAGLLALQLGRGGISRVREITGLSRPTIQRGRDEIQREERSSERERVRKRGAGRKLVEKNDLKS
jgi:hypothetical protein